MKGEVSTRPSTVTEHPLDKAPRKLRFLPRTTAAIVAHKTFQNVTRKNQKRKKREKTLAAVMFFFSKSARFGAAGTRKLFVFNIPKSVPVVKTAKESSK